jgi:hypothetical protein
MLRLHLAATVPDGAGDTLGGDAVEIALLVPKAGEPIAGDARPTAAGS